MRCASLLVLAPLLIAAQAPDRAENWWRHVQILAADDMAGREAGSEGHRRASDYVAGRFAEYGLEPAGENGSYFQAVTLEQSRVIAAGTRVTLTAGGASRQLPVPGDLFLRVAGGPPPERVEGGLVFIGYGLHLPDSGHDDLAGVDLRGKVAVVLAGLPAGLPDRLVSHALAERSRLLAARGALGLIQIPLPSQMDQPWATVTRLADAPGMYPANQAAPFLNGYMNPASAERLFTGSGHSLAELVAAAEESRPIAGFPLRPRLSAVVASESRTIATRNVVARLPGSDPTLAAEHVVLTAHLDGMGVGRSVDGDSINNGALDNAAGVAALLDIAALYQRERARPRRSILFVALTAEEKGLLGSRWFVRSPTVPRASIVANLNYDMALPLFPLTSVIALGAEESSLGADARAVGEAMGLPLTPDPFPERNSFIRSDQYSFIEAGIPALAFKFGFLAGTPEAEIEANWRRTRYHGPSDDAAQAVQREDEIRLHDFIARLALRIADAEQRPRWNDDSAFRR